MIANQAEAISMLINLAFTVEERASLEALALQTSAEGWAPPVSVAGLLVEWSGLARDVGGSSLTASHYANALFARDALQSVLEQCPIELQKKLEQVLARFDGEFKRGTIEDAPGTVPANGKEGWWWKRKPRLGLLAESLN